MYQMRIFVNLKKVFSEKKNIIVKSLYNHRFVQDLIGLKATLSREKSGTLNNNQHFSIFQPDLKF